MTSNVAKNGLKDASGTPILRWVRFCGAHFPCADCTPRSTRGSAERGSHVFETASRKRQTRMLALFRGLCWLEALLLMMTLTERTL